jgi:hypothetical protein
LPASATGGTGGSARFGGRGTSGGSILLCMAAVNCSSLRAASSSASGRATVTGLGTENTKETYLSADRSHSNGRHRFFHLLRRLFCLRFYTVRFAVRHALAPSLFFDAHIPMVAVGTFFLPRAPPPPTLAAPSDARR